MTKIQKETYWMDCIQQCRMSGLSDYAWCHQNGISASSFYYHIKQLRKKGSQAPLPVQKISQRQEVVPIHYNELQKTETAVQEKQKDSVGIRLEFKDAVLNINNGADPAIIAATLKILQQLC